MMIAATATCVPTNQVSSVALSSAIARWRSDKAMATSCLVAAPSLTALPIADAMASACSGATKAARRSRGMAMVSSDVRR